MDINNQAEEFPEREKNAVQINNLHISPEITNKISQKIL